MLRKLQEQMIPWEERIRRLEDTSDIGTRLLEENLSCFFLGAGLITQSKYQEWVLENILKKYGIKGTHIYGSLIGFEGDAMDINDIQDEDFDIMYRLMIEPFYLINEKEEQQNGVSDNNTYEH